MNCGTSCAIHVSICGVPGGPLTHSLSTFAGMVTVGATTRTSSIEPADAAASKVCWACILEVQPEGEPGKPWNASTTGYCRSRAEGLW